MFLCADCATGSLWYDMVGSLMDPEAPSGVVPPGVEAAENEAVEQWAEGPIDPWQASA